MGSEDARRTKQLAHYGFQFRAKDWERSETAYDHIFVAMRPHERDFVDKCLAAERTKDWSTRLAEYWQEYGYAMGHRRLPHEDLSKGKQTKLAEFSSDSESDSLFQKFYAMGMPDLLRRCRKARIGTEFHGFMQLPRELRDLIYSHAVVTGSRFIFKRRSNQNSSLHFIEDGIGELYYRYVHGNEERPLRGPHPARLIQSRFKDSLPFNDGLGEMSLLKAVCFTIQVEAAEVFFSRNQLILPFGFFSSVIAPRGFNVPHLSSGRKPRRNEWDCTLLARDVSYTFDMRDINVDDMENRYNCSHTFRQQIDEGSIRREDAMLELHNRKTSVLEFGWVDRIEAIKRMTLDRLQLSFEECYCSVGCCRKVAWVLDRFLYDDVPPGGREEDVFCDKDWTTRPPLVIEVLGWRSENEKTMIQEKLGKLRSTETIEVRLIQDERSEAEKRRDFINIYP